MSAVAPKKDLNAARNAGKFPRSARLLRHADFERVYKQGRRHFSASITVFFLERDVRAKTKTSQPHGTSGIRVGFTVGRALGGAVERNRMKRRLREIVRQTRPSDGRNVDVVINPKKSLMAADFSVVLKEVARAFEFIEQKTTGSSGSKPSTESEPK